MNEVKEQERIVWCPYCRMKVLTPRYCWRCGAVCRASAQIQCGHCGRKMAYQSEETDRFCRSCGKPVNFVSVEPTEGDQKAKV